MALERFIPKSPDPFIRNSQDFEVAKFGHLNTIIEYINSYVVTDSLQLAGSGPITSTARYITDATGVNSAISISTIRVGIGTNTPSSELHIDGHSGFGASLKITTNKVNSVAYVQMISDYVTGFEQYQYGGPGWGWPNWTTNRSGGTAAAPTTAPNNYGLNEYAIWSYDGTGNGQGYAMMTRTSETWTSTAHGIYTTFSTVATGSTSLVERMRFSAGGNITFNNASDTAKVSIKGSGTTSATNSFLVQNSAGTQLLNLADNGRLTIGVNATYFGDGGNFISNYAGGVSALIVQANGTTAKALQVRGNTGTADIQTWETVNGGSVLGVFTADGKLGIGTNAPTSKLQIVTDDATNPQAFGNQTTVMAGTASQGALISAFSSTNGAFLNALWPGNAWFKMNYGGTNHTFSTSGTVMAVIDTNTTFGNGAISLGARLGIKGSGSTSATTSLLVQNSAGTATLQVRDDGHVLLNRISSLDGSEVLYVSPYFRSNSGFIYIANSGAIPFLYGDSTLTQIFGGNAERLRAMSGGVGINTFAANNASAQLQIDSTTRGFLPPRMTTAQRVAIASPANGLIVFDTDVQNLCYRRDGVWVQATFAAV